MALVTMTHGIKDPTGVPYNGAKAVVRLIADAEHVNALGHNGSGIVGRNLRPIVVTNGSISFQAEPNENIDPDNSYYTLTYEFPGGPSKPLNFTVPPAGGAVEENLIDPPAGLPTLLSNLLASDQGASNVGTAAIAGVVGDTVQDVLAEFQTDKADSPTPGTLTTALVTDPVDQDFDGEKRAIGDFFFHAQHPFWSLAGFKSEGVDATGGNDSAPGTEVAVNEAADAGKSLFVDPGIYAMSAIHFPGDENFVTLTKGLTIWARPGTATFLIDELRPSWKAVFGSPVHSTNDLTDLKIIGLTFDAQSHINNPTIYPTAEWPTTTEVGVAGQTRAMISAFFGRRIEIGWCTFKRQTGRNVLFLVSQFTANDVRDAEVHDCVFEDIGTVDSWHDHSTVFIDGIRPALRRCTFLARPHNNGSWSSAWSPYEIHGGDSEVSDIRVENYASCGLVVSSRPANTGNPAEGHLARNIRGRNVGSGVQLQPQQDSRGYDYLDCRAVIAPDQWPTAPGPDTGSTITRYPGLERRSAFNLQAASPTVRGVRIRDLRGRWLPATGGYNGHENGINWNRFDTNAPVDDIDIHIDGLDLEDCPASAIRAGAVRSLRGWRIRGAKVRNLGRGGLGAKHQSFVSIGKQVWTGATRPVGVQNMEISEPQVIDDQGVSTFRHLVAFDDPESKNDPTVTTTSGSGIITTTNTTILDSGSLIVHPNLPAGTTLRDVRVFAPGSTFNVVEWGVSSVATASGAAAGTITSQPPTTDNVRVEDPNVSLTDGANPSLLRLQSGQSVYVKGRSQRFATVSGPGGADVGSRLLEAPTGIERRQDTRPTGNLWLPTDGNPLRLSVPVAAWYDAAHLNLDDGATLTQWTDISGNGRHAPVAAGAPKLFRAAGPSGQPVVRFAVTDAVKVAFTLAQPYAVVLIAKHRVTTGIQTWIDGNTLNTGIIQKTSGHLLQLYAGAFLVGSAPGTTWFVAVGIFNGASSNLRQNGGAGVSGNAGTATPGGITIGTNASFASGADGDVQDVIVLAGLPTVADLNNLSRYAPAKAGVTWTTAV